MPRLLGRIVACGFADRGGARFSIDPSSPLSFETCSRKATSAMRVRGRRDGRAGARLHNPLPRAFNIGQPSIPAPGSAWSRDYLPVRVGHPGLRNAPCVELWGGKRVMWSGARYYLRVQNGLLHP
eukprot:scaffold77381_cov90-Phaeocystis_antarctica.AAC.1